MSGDGRLLSRSNSDQTCQGPSYREGGAEFTRTLQRAARRDGLGIWTLRITQRFRALEIGPRAGERQSDQSRYGPATRPRSLAQRSLRTSANTGRSRDGRPFDLYRERLPSHCTDCKRLNSAPLFTPSSLGGRFFDAHRVELWLTVSREECLAEELNGYHTSNPVFRRLLAPLRSAISIKPPYQ